MEKNDHPGKILLVDDTTSTLDMMKSNLESEGYKVYIATSGEKAIKSAELTLPDLILLDILMPGIDGFETCRQLKANKNIDQEGVKEIVDAVHFRKIDISDEVLILNIDGYIGESTRNELNYARRTGKKISYLED